jgi:two-component system sensor histidine kinase UhpB
MSLRQRLLLAVAAALFASLALGTWLTVWQAHQMVRAELTASLKTGRRSVIAALQDMPPPPNHAALARLVAGFDGSRHVTAELVDPGIEGGQGAVQSHPALPTTATPAWFAALATPNLQPAEIAFPGGLIRLATNPASEVGERWSEARRLILLLALSSALAALLCFATAAWSLRPLRPLTDALLRLEHGQEADPVTAGGPPEIVHLATAFNRMQEALVRAARENARLSAQLDLIAEEERTELARDLHDEIGPLLFALTAWAAAARIHETDGNGAAALTSLASLEQTAALLQITIRDLLRRLRDSAPESSDLAGAVSDLLEFWRGIRPQTMFKVEIPEEADTLKEPVRAALFRVAQEGVSNAIRHANPTEIHVTVAVQAFRAALTVQDNGSSAAPQGQSQSQSHGLGLLGLEERLQALGGALEIQRGAGWRITGWAPTARAAVS